LITGTVLPVFDATLIWAPCIKAMPYTSNTTEAVSRLKTWTTGSADSISFGTTASGSPGCLMTVTSNDAIRPPSVSTVTVVVPSSNASRSTTP